MNALSQRLRRLNFRIGLACACFISRAAVAASPAAGDANDASAGLALPAADTGGAKATTFGTASATTKARDAENHFLGLFRTYEPTQVGWTKDAGDDGNMDFTLSTMFPLFHGYYPDRRFGADPFPHAWRIKPYPYLAATIRDGFYVTTRPSSPVIGKRFNPLLALRCWTFDPKDTSQSLTQFVEVVYAHESNGQDIASAQRFASQTDVFLGNDPANAGADARATAVRYARDDISRGWDYWGVHASHDFLFRDLRLTVLARCDYYLRHGLLQGPAEEYNAWETGPVGNRRRFYDGLSLRTSLQTGSWTPLPGFELAGQFAVAWSTGTQNPFQANTWKFEMGMRVLNIPIHGWYRTGYNSDLIDYYRRDSSWGVAISFWDF